MKFRVSRDHLEVWLSSLRELVPKGNTMSPRTDVDTVGDHFLPHFYRIEILSKAIANVRCLMRGEKLQNISALRQQEWESGRMLYEDFIVMVGIVAPFGFHSIDETDPNCVANLITLEIEDKVATEIRRRNASRDANPIKHETLSNSAIGVQMS